MGPKATLISSHPMICRAPNKTCGNPRVNALLSILVLILFWDACGIKTFAGEVLANIPHHYNHHHEVEFCHLQIPEDQSSSSPPPKSHHGLHQVTPNFNDNDEEIENEMNTMSKGHQMSTRNNNPNVDARNLIVVCHIRTLNSDFNIENLTSSLPLTSITKLKLICNDVLFFESIFTSQTLTSKLSELQELSIEKCKLKYLPTSSFSEFHFLKTLTIETGNSDWGTRALEISSDAFSHSLQHLNLGFNHLWNLPEKLLCQLNLLESLNLTHNSLSDVLDLGLPKFVTLSIFDSPSQEQISSSLCLNELKELDLSFNNLRTLGGRRFETMRRLTELRVEHNALENLFDESFFGLALLRILDLSSNKLVTVPSKLFYPCKMLKELNLSNNSIKALPPGLLSSQEHLEVVDLSSNQLTSSSITNQDTFKGLVRLIILNLANNRITELSASTFVDLNQVQNLNLENNQISSIEDSTFQHLNNLHTLNLARNKLLKVSSRMLDGLFVLSKLSLDYNLITDIEIGSFRNCTSLQDLGLVGNQFNSVPEALQGLALLKTLDIGENLIASLSNDSFAGLGQLYGLRIVGNRLSSLPRALCDPLKRLRVFNLAQNRISSIGSNTFTGCPELRVLLLNSNSLEEIPSSFPSQLSSLLWLNVSENRITELNYHLLPTSLEWIDVSHNQIGVLNGAWMTAVNSTSAESHAHPTHHLHLRVVDASYNEITQLDYHSIPANLETLKLGNNKITKIVPDTFSRLSRLRRVELYGNQIENLTMSALRLPISTDTEHHHLQPAKPKSNAQFYLGGNPFLCDCELEWLTKINAPQIGGGPRQYPIVVDLDAIVCRLPYSRSESRIPLPAMKSSDFLCKYESICFSTCHCCGFTCDCEMTCSSNCSCYHDDNWSANVVDCSNSAHTSVPNNLPMDSTDVYLDGNNIPILKSHTFIGRKNLKTLFLNNSNIHSIANKSFNGLRALKILHLESNLLTKLEGFEFEQLTTLNELYLHDNLLEIISNATFLPLKSLEILRLDGNRLVAFSVWQLSLNPYLVDIGMARNRWNCGDCAFLHQFYNWVTDNSKKMMDLDHIRCVWNKTMEEGPHLIDYNNTCEKSWALLPGPFNDFDLNATYPFIILASFSIVLLIVVLGLILGRDTVRVWIFAKCGVRLCSSCDNYENGERLCREVGSDKLIYDSYFIYSEKDEEFVSRHVADDLETIDNYKLCLQHRDLIYNANSSCSDLKELMTSAASSCKSIVVFLSRNFCATDWTSNEYRSALFSVIKCASACPKNVIIVHIEKIPTTEEEELSSNFSDLKSWLRHNSHNKRQHQLYFGSKRFWQTFKYLLPDPSNAYKSNVTSHTTTSSSASSASSSSSNHERQDCTNSNCEALTNNFSSHQQNQQIKLTGALQPKYGSSSPRTAPAFDVDGSASSHLPQLKLKPSSSSLASSSSSSCMSANNISKITKNSKSSPTPSSNNNITAAKPPFPKVATSDDAYSSSPSTTIPSFLFQPNECSPVPMGHFRYAGQQHNNNHSSNSLAAAYNDEEHVYSSLDPPSPQHQIQLRNKFDKTYQQHQQQHVHNPQLASHIHLPNGYTYSPQKHPSSSQLMLPPTYSASTENRKTHDVSTAAKGQVTNSMTGYNHHPGSASIENDSIQTYLV